MATTILSPVRVKSFPEHALTAALEQWWDATVATKQDDPFSKPGTLYDLIVEIDSLSAVDVLIVIENELGFEPPVGAIKRGGYKNRQEMIDHLIPVMRKLYESQTRK